MQSYENLVHDYLATISEMKTGDDLSRYLHAGIEQIEYPNKLTPDGATRNLATMLEGAERGKAILSAQTYEVQNIIESEQGLLAEVIWTGTLKIPVGTLAAGDQMRARFACVFEFRDGLIYRQRNYDCFDPF